jgi:hypothetical protein
MDRRTLKPWLRCLSPRRPLRGHRRLRWSLLQSPRRQVPGLSVHDYVGDCRFRPIVNAWLARDQDRGDLLEVIDDRDGRRSSVLAEPDPVSSGTTTSATHCRRRHRQPAPPQRPPNRAKGSVPSRPPRTRKRPPPHRPTESNRPASLRSDRGIHDGRARCSRCPAAVALLPRPGSRGAFRHRRDQCLRPPRCRSHTKGQR